MRISLKIFIFTYCIMMLITIFGGFLLIDYEYQENLEQARKIALEDNRTLYTYFTMMDEMLGNVSSAACSLERFANRIASESQKEVFIGQYEKLEEHILSRMEQKVEDDQCQYVVITQGNQTKIQVTCKYKEQYMINYYDC